MKLICRIMLCCVLLAGTAACNDDEDQPVVYQRVTYASLNGTWMLTEWNGAPVPEGNYVYITFDRAEHTFEMYENMGSMYSHKSTGSFLVEDDEKLGATILSGEYDYDRGEWTDDYFVTEMTDETMKWTKKNDASDVCVYTRCAEVPADIVSGSRSH